MINYMLGTLEAQIHQSLAYQNAGDISTAINNYEQTFEALCFYEERGYKNVTDKAWRLVLESQPTPSMTLYIHGLIQYYRQNYLSVLETVHAALLLTPAVPYYYFLLARAYSALADFSEAHTAYLRVQELAPDVREGHEGIFSISIEQEMPGANYYVWLQRFHEWLKPESYVEIGIGQGRSLALTGPDTKAYGIDPNEGFWEKLNYVCPYEAAKLFPLASDEFFEKYNLREVLNRESFDLGFIDGLHLFEQALKDFINLERYARKDSVILLHDCLPVSPIIADRKQRTNLWTGDVWRIIPCLRAFRPDLKIMTIPTKPSGLGVVTCLDATSNVLSDNYEEIVRYYLTLQCPESFDQRRVVCCVGPADEDYIKVNFAGKDRKV